MHEAYSEASMVLSMYESLLYGLIYVCVTFIQGLYSKQEEKDKTLDKWAQCRTHGMRQKIHDKYVIT